MILLWQIGQSPVQVASRPWIIRRIFGRVNPEVFFTPESLNHQEAESHHVHGHMVVPTAVAPTFVVVETELVLLLLIVLFYLPPDFG